MELILENIYHQKITLGNYKYDFLLLKIDDSSIPVTINSSKGMTEDGESYINSLLNKRQIKITIGLKGYTEEEVLNKKRALQKILNPKLGQLIMSYLDYSIAATIDNYPKYKEVDNLYVETTINFICLKPYWAKSTLNGGTINTWIKNTDFPINFLSENTANMLDGTNFTKTTTFNIVDSSHGTLTQDKTSGTITIKTKDTTENGLITSYINGGLSKSQKYTFAIDSNISVNSLSVNILCDDTTMPSDDGLSYGWNCVTKVDTFFCRDANGTATGSSIAIGTYLCVLWANYDKGLLQVEYIENGAYKSCWITNDITCLDYRYKDMFYNNQNASLPLYFDDGTPAGSLDPYEKATILYKYNGKYCVIYNVGANTLRKCGTTTYEGSPGFMNEKALTSITLGQTGFNRGSVTFTPEHSHKTCRLSFTTKTANATLAFQKPKLETGEVANPYNESINDNPSQDIGIELGYQDPELLKNFVNNGEVDTSATITFKMSGSVSGPYILNVTTGKKIKLKGTLLPGDIVKVDTGEKKVYYSNSATEEKEDYKYIDNETDWDFLLIPGDNVFSFGATSGKELLEVFIEYTEKFVEVF